jgi:hypothetical protein
LKINIKIVLGYIPDTTVSLFQQNTTAMNKRRVRYIVEQAVINHHKMIDNDRLNAHSVRAWLTENFPEFQICNAIKITDQKNLWNEVLNFCEQTHINDIRVLEQLMSKYRIKAIKNKELL